MGRLAQSKCEPCRAGAPRVSQEEREKFLTEIPSWEIIEREGVNQLQRIFQFNDFQQSLTFTNKIGDIAEQEGHHPAILTEWGKVTVTWWTHKIGGLHKNDFIMAAKTDQIYKG